MAPKQKIHPSNSELKNKLEESRALPFIQTFLIEMLLKGSNWIFRFTVYQSSHTNRSISNYTYCKIQVNIFLDVHLNVYKSKEEGVEKPREERDQEQSD